MVQSINRGTGDPLARDRLEKTILLQDKIEFANEVSGGRKPCPEKNGVSDNIDSLAAQGRSFRILAR
jgi:hypothetical protein